MCPGESLRNTMAFDSRDWSVDRRDAWMYAIICGWDTDEAWSQVAKMHGWPPEAVDRAKELHAKFAAAFPEVP